MVQANFAVENYEWEQFKRKVGYRNAAPILRNFIKMYVGDIEVDELELVKEYADSKKRYDEANLKFHEIKSKYDAMTERNEQTKLTKLREEAEIDKRLNDIEYETAKAELHRIA